MPPDSGFVPLVHEKLGSTWRVNGANAASWTVSPDGTVPSGVSVGLMIELPVICEVCVIESVVRVSVSPLYPIERARRRQIGRRCGGDVRVRDAVNVSGVSGSQPHKQREPLMLNVLRLLSSRTPHSWSLRNAVAISGRALWVGRLRESISALMPSMHARESGIGQDKTSSRRGSAPADDPVTRQSICCN